MLCAPLDWQYAELPSSASDAVLCWFVRCGTSIQIEEKKEEKLQTNCLPSTDVETLDKYIHRSNVWTFELPGLIAK